MKRKSLFEIDKFDKDLWHGTDNDVVFQVVEEAFVQDLNTIKMATKRNKVA